MGNGKGEGEGMSENLKLMIFAALIGGTNLGQFVTGTLPAKGEVIETTANNERMRDDLAACMEDLRSCYKECSHVSMDHTVGAVKPPVFTPERWAQANENLNELADPDTEKFVEAPDNWAWAEFYNE